VDEQIDLVALTWLGREDYSATDWSSVKESISEVISSTTGSSDWSSKTAASLSSEAFEPGSLSFVSSFSIEFPRLDNQETDLFERNVELNFFFSRSGRHVRSVWHVHHPGNDNGDDLSSLYAKSVVTRLS
jgi:hypothetical protein